MSGPLTGVRIVDMTTVLMGPYATQILGDLGADVIKVEPPAGDNVRSIGPARHEGMSGLFLHCNRNKRDIVLDLKHPEGKAALLKLVESADVFIYNVRPQAMARLGLDYETLAAVNPGIVYVGAYGYGQTGPYASKPAYDDLIQGAVGIPALTMRAGSDVPRYAPLAMVDRIMGLNVANAVSAALFHRERTGEGQRIDIPMFETMAAFVLSDHMMGYTFEPPLSPPGYSRLLNEFRKPYRTRDGHVCVLVYNDKQWKTFFTLIGRPELMEQDPRFSTISKRTENIRELYRMVAEVMATRTTAEWLVLLEEADIPVMPMNTMESLIEDPHLNAVGFFQEVDHPSEGRVRQMAVGSTWSRTQPAFRSHAPRFGQHSDQVLREAGYGEDEIAALVERGVTVLDKPG
ncbi:CaiB/BaiF CoA transferase family protein [Achromobacter aloeverae]